MPDPVEGALAEAVALHRLVDSICDCCRYEQEHRTYLEASVEFLNLIVKTGRATQRYLQQHIRLIRKHPHHAQVLRLFLVQVKGFWSEIHTFAKPAADADTLNVPLELIRFAERRLHQVPRFSGTRIVLLVSEHLNYFQYRSQHLSSLTAELSTVVPGVPNFPKKLALIGIPYSQAQRLFPNLLIFHELGHFAFEDCNFRARLATPIKCELDRALGKPPPDPETEAWLSEILYRWCEEIFCDLFAVALVGPSFSLSTIELFDVLGLLQEEQATSFSETHPAEAYRFHEHLHLLKILGWWDPIAGIDAEAIPTMERLANIPIAKYEFEGDDDFGKILLDAFWGLIDTIRAVASDATKGTPIEVKEFEDRRGEIQKCLAEAIVPSATQQGAPPGPVTIINASHEFYLENFDKLLRNIDGRSMTNVSDRSEVLHRLELWTVKALEDCDLIAGSP